MTRSKFQVTLYRVDAASGQRGRPARTMGGALKSALAMASAPFLSGIGFTSERYGPDLIPFVTSNWPALACEMARTPKTMAALTDARGNFTLKLRRI